jgi:hypothetical protein
MHGGGGGSGGGGADRAASPHAPAVDGATGLPIRTTLTRPRERRDEGVWGYQPRPGSPPPSRDVLRFVQSLDLVGPPPPPPPPRGRARAARLNQVAAAVPRQIHGARGAPIAPSPRDGGSLAPVRARARTRRRGRPHRARA